MQNQDVHGRAESTEVLLDLQKAKLNGSEGQRSLPSLLFVSSTDLRGKRFIERELEFIAEAGVLGSGVRSGTIGVLQFTAQASIAVHRLVQQVALVGGLGLGAGLIECTP